MHLPVAVRVLDAAPARRGPTASGLVSEEQMASRMSVAVWPSEHECGREVAKVTHISLYIQKSCAQKQLQPQVSAGSTSRRSPKRPRMTQQDRSGNETATIITISTSLQSEAQRNHRAPDIRRAPALNLRF